MSIYVYSVAVVFSTAFALFGRVYYYENIYINLYNFRLAGFIGYYLEMVRICS